MAGEREEGMLHQEAKSDKLLAETDWSKVPFWKSQRMLTAVVTFWGFVCLYLQRINLNIAMVCMVRSHDNNGSVEEVQGADAPGVADVLVRMNYSHPVSPSLHLPHSTNISVQHFLTTAATLLNSDPHCSAKAAGLTSDYDETGEFVWSKELQGLLLGAFYWGYLILQIPGGRLSEHYGPKSVVLYTMLLVAVLSLISPVSARASPWFLLAVRILIGLGQGAMYPASQALFTRWAPPNERARLVTFSFSGGQLGSAVIFPLGGFLCSVWGWESVFYVMGTAGLVWCFLWLVLIYDSPSKSRRISKIERGYIQYHVSFRDTQKQGPFPWKDVLTCVPLWAIIIAQTCGNYGFYMLLTQMPAYMKEVLMFDLRANGVYSMLPFLSMSFFMSVAGVTCDLFISRQMMSRVWARKLMSSLGLFCPALCLVGLTYLDCSHRALSVAILCLAAGLSGLNYAGYMVNHGDLAPTLAGTLFGLTNMVASIPGILAPYIVAALTTNKTREEWQVTFFIAAAVYVFGGVVYLVCAKASVQKWAGLPQSTSDIGRDIPESRHVIRMIRRDGD